MANFNVNKIMLGGRVASDVELNTTQNGISVTSFTVAVNRRSGKAGEKPESDFFQCVAWRGTAEFFTQYFRKGMAVFLIGSIENTKWTDNNGVTHHGNRVTVDEVYFVDAKSENAGGMPAVVTKPMPGVYANPAAGQMSGGGLEELSASDELPF